MGARAQMLGIDGLIDQLRIRPCAWDNVMHLCSYFISSWDAEISHFQGPCMEEEVTWPVLNNRMGDVVYATTGPESFCLFLHDLLLLLSAGWIMSGWPWNHNVVEQQDRKRTCVPEFLLREENHPRELPEQKHKKLTLSMKNINDFYYIKALRFEEYLFLQ